MEHGKPILFHRKRRRIKRKIEYWKTAGEGGEGKGRKRWKHKRISNSNGCIPAMHQQQRCHQWLQLSRTHNLPPSKKSELSGLATCSTGSTKTTSTPASLTPARCSLWFLPFFFWNFVVWYLNLDMNVVDMIIFPVFLSWLHIWLVYVVFGNLLHSSLGNMEENCVEWAEIINASLTLLV